MFRTGICTQEEFLRAGDARRFVGARVAYSLLNVGDCPTEEQVRVFEDICFTLRTSNGTFRTTYRQRFDDVNSAAMRWMKRWYDAAAKLHVEDRAASHGLTSAEWAQQLFPIFPQVEFEASDLLLQLVELILDSGETYIIEPGGQPLQYIRPPFVLSLSHPESWRYPLNRLKAARALKRFRDLALSQDWQDSSGGNGYRVTKIPCIHPEALALSQHDRRFQFRLRSVLERSSPPCDVLRTMNILNKSYFSPQLLGEGARAAFDSLRPGGLWIVGRTLEEDFTNHVTFLRRHPAGWEVVERIGAGSEIEDLALRAVGSFSGASG